MRLIEVKMNYKIFLDQDGVLADFDKGVHDLTGQTIEQLGKKAMWKAVYSVPDFFEKLDWMPDGKELWEYTKKYKPSVLTGLPGKNGEEQKRIWVAKHMGSQVPVIVCPAAQKQKYAEEAMREGFTPILIDDKNDNIQRWNAVGGIGILHRNTAHSVMELQKLGL